MSDATDCAPLAAGARVGAWQIVSLIEREPYTCRYLAEDGRQRVVIQELLPQPFVCRDGATVQLRGGEDRNTLRWWLRNYLDKAGALATLKQPGIARVLDAFEANGTGYAVIEHRAGETLAERVRARGALDWRDYLPTLYALLDALADAHMQNIVLRDITPAHLIFGSDGQVLLSGFGPLRGPVRFREQTVFSSAPLAYAAPEELVAGGTIGPWTDVHGLAASSAFALLGHVPPDAVKRATRALHLEPAVPLPLNVRALLEAALGAPPEERPGIVTWQRTLRTSVGAPAAVAPARSAVRDASSRVPRSKQRLAVAAATVVMFGGVGTWYALSTSTAGQPAPALAESAPVLEEATAAAPADAGIQEYVPSAAAAEEPAASEETPVATAPVAAAPSPSAAAAPAGTAIVAIAPPPSVASKAAEPLPVAAAPVFVASPPAPAKATVSAAVATVGASSVAGNTAAGKSAPVAAASTVAMVAPAQKGATTEVTERERRTISHEEQLQNEKAQCKTHVSDLLDGRPVTYADLAMMKGVEKSADGQLKLSRVATDDGRRAALQVDTHGCVVSVRVN